jgi:mono/diheme cytochrome c family protein/cytochrome c553
MRYISLGLLFTSIPLLAQTSAPTTEQKEYFENKIRPLLAQNCFACHTNSQMGGLRLDSREGLLKGGKSGPAAVPGDPDKSLLITAVRQTTDLKMPKYGHLTDEQIQNLTVWIKDGAAWPTDEPVKTAQGEGYLIRPEARKFWSFQPLQKPAAPKVKDAAWAVNDIDRFVLAKLEKEGLKPTAPADRQTLLRRITYDLTGLPPAYDEVKAFESDKSANAYEKVVDRLLASSQYGEMWARHWLDVTRYAEDDYRIAQKDMHRERYKFAYTFRDWLINSLNTDMPYDMFVKAQLAGDLMDEKDRDKMIPALGMNGLGVWQFNDNPAAIERAEEWHDKVDATSKALLGLTVGCARCHDHKYDPIPQKDYYRLASVFASTTYHAYPLVAKQAADEYDAKKKEMEEKEKKLKEFQEQLSTLEAQVLFAQTEDYMVAAWRAGSEKHATVASIAEKYKLDPEILERWAHFVQKKPTNYSYLVPWQKMIAGGGDLDQAKTLAHDFYQKAVEVDKQHAKIKTENEEQMAKLKEATELFDPMPNGIKRKLIQHQIDLKALDREASYLWRDMFEIDLPESQINMNDMDDKKPGLFKLTDWALERRLNPEFAGHLTRSKADIEAFKKAMPPEYPIASGLQDNKEPADLKVFVRGNPYAFGEDAPRGFLSVLSEGDGNFSKGSGRLELADDIVKQPLAMRVIVNRIWRWHMGTGIVDTPNNFGVAGDRPSNPELLEYLASKFVADGMSLKKLTKAIVMSRTYQLSTAPVEPSTTKDGANRYYWRANRRRLEAEGIWDGLLAAAGKLDLAKVGGPSAEMDTKMSRRGMYGEVSRVFPNDFQTLFDLPIPTLSAEKRYTTNVALQRLFFLNNDFVHKQAAAMAERVRGAGNDDAQVRKAFEIVYQRDPSAEELKVSLELLHEPAPPPVKAEMSGPSSALAAKPTPQSAGVVASMPAEEAKPAPTPPKGPETPLEALCWALLSSNEFLFLN